MKQNEIFIFYFNRLRLRTTRTAPIVFLLTSLGPGRRFSAVTLQEPKGEPSEKIF